MLSAGTLMGTGPPHPPPGGTTCVMSLHQAVFLPTLWLDRNQVVDERPRCPRYSMCVYWARLPINTPRASLPAGPGPPSLPTTTPV